MRRSLAPLPDRLVDPGSWVGDFTDAVLVECPSCRGQATASGPGPCHAGARVVCAGCGFSDQRDGASRRLGEPIDPWFGLPLWLRTDCAGEVLWAYDHGHLDLLERYVGARLREHRRQPGAPATMVEKLPRWIKRRGNAAAIRAAIGRLRVRG